VRVLVLGGYGLLGSAITRRLIQDGHIVTGLGRTAKKGAGLIPQARWIGADIAKLTRAENWQAHLRDIDIVVNASGALQTGLRDNVAAVQYDAMRALFQACEDGAVSQLIQISAPDVGLTSSTEFYRTKAKADTELKASSLNWVIFRPGLVISPHAYGGTSLMRMLAAFPFVQPIILAKAPIQTVSIEDVSFAVSRAINETLSGIDVDLVEADTQTLGALTLAFRKWLGFKAPKAVLELPLWIGKLIARFADILGWLGWRSALRTTSLKVLENGVKGQSKPWADISGQRAKPLSDTLEALPSTLQERIFARASLAFPFLLLILSGFWIVSGLIGMTQKSAAVKTLQGVVEPAMALAFVQLGSLADIAIGAALLFRPLTRLACLAGIGLSLGYLLASAIYTPHLWSDPLGPMVKVFPAIALAVIISALMEER